MIEEKGNWTVITFLEAVCVTSKMTVSLTANFQY